jgi:integrase
VNALNVISNSLSIGQVANDVASQHVFQDYTQRKSDNTLRRHKADLALFREYLNHVGIFPTGDLATDPAAWQGMTWGIVKGFVEWQLQRGFAIGSINSRLSSVKVYAMLALKAGAIEANEGYLIKNVSGYASTEGRKIDLRRTTSRLGRKKSEAVGITPAQAKALKRQPDTPIGRRNRLIMCLLLEHGLRVSELSLLKTSDFDRDTNLLSFYRPKVDKPAIPHLLRNSTLSAMLDYLDSDALALGPLLRGSRKSRTGDNLTEPGMAEQNINALVGKLGRAIGLDGLSPHDCRHYAATKLAKNRPVKELMDFFGWTSAATAMRYVDSGRFVESDDD